jgi:hypothetical protein
MPSRARTGVGLILGVLLTTAVFATAAHASFLIYGCAPNLCRVSPDGTGGAPLTIDGSAGAPYGAPSLSRDGSKLAFVEGTQLFVSDANAQNRVGPISNFAFGAYMRPDGGQLADIEDFQPGFAVCTFNLDGGGRNCPYGTASAGWAPDNGLLASISAGAPSFNKQICHLAAAGGQTCADVRANDPANDLYDPAVSPDGSTLAVTVGGGVGGSVSGHIALYNYATGQFERNLTAGTADEFPAWSPDGSRIAFQRGGSIYVTGAGDAAGSEHQLVANGTQPTWGGPPDATGGPAPTSGGGGGSAISPRSLHLKVKRPKGGTRGLAKGIRLSFSCPSACRATVTALISKRLAHKLHLARAKLVKVGTAHASLRRAGTKTLKIKPARGALRRLRRVHSFRLTLRVKVKIASGRTLTASKSLTA